MSSSDRLWPDDLAIGDRFEFDGHEYEVVGTGPGEATLSRVEDDRFRIEVGRWAISNDVWIELEVTLAQDEFGQSVDTETDRGRGADD